jgi:hypothetical protein
MLDHHRRDWRDLDHLVAQRRWILSLQQGAAVATGIGVVLNHHIHPLDWQQLRATAGMARLATALAATAFAALWGLKTRAISGGWFGGVARAAADPLPQAGQFAGQGGELAAELLDLLLLGQD